MTNELAIPLRTRIEMVRDKSAFRGMLAWVTTDEYSRIVDNYCELLDSHERRYFESLHFERRRISYLLGRFAAKNAVAGLVDETDFIKLGIVPGVFNQPVVHQPTSEVVGVSISHSGDVACALAFPQVHPMAIDIEQIDITKVDAIKAHITPAELDLTEHDRPPEEVLCTLIWTAKEALSKSLGCGMTAPFELMETTAIVVDSTAFCGRFKNFSQYKFRSWVTTNYIITIVSPRKSELKTTIQTMLDDIECRWIRSP